MSEPGSGPSGSNALAPKPALKTSTERTTEDSILTTLTDTDQFLPAMKLVFEKGKQDTFRDKLHVFLSKKKLDIQDLCNTHYQDFIRSVDELWSLRNDANALKAQISDVNERVQVAGQYVLEQSEELAKARQVRTNLQRAIHALENGQQVLSLCVKAAEQIGSRKFHAALKSLEQLEYTHLPNITSHDFATEMEARVHEMREAIRQAVLLDFKDWLVTVRKQGHDIGKAALSAREAQLQAEEKLKETQRAAPIRATPRRLTKTESQVAHDPANVMTPHNVKRRLRSATTITRSVIPGGMDRDQEGRDRSPSTDAISLARQVDCKPVYQCVHVYRSLGADADFRVYYTKNRTQQATLVAQPNATQGFLEQRDSYICQLVGFFVVEDIISKSAVDLTTSSQIDCLWDLVMEGACAYLRREIWKIEDHRVLLETKENIMLFVHTMQGLGFNLNPISHLLEKTTLKFESLLLQEWKTKFVAILQSERYDQLTVNNVEEYRQLIQPFKLEQWARDKESITDFESTFPQYYDFSSTVPETCQAVVMFMEQYYAFIADISEDDDIIRKATDQLLSDCLIKAYHDFIDHSPSMAVSQAVQISLNTQVLESTCQVFEEFCASLNEGRMVILPMQARAQFQDVRSKAESSIFELVHTKVEEFMDGAQHVNWTMSKPPSGPNDYIDDLVQYIRVQFIVTENLSTASRDAIYYATCKKISSHFLEILSDNTIRKITVAGFVALNQDLECAEEFADSAPADDLRVCFAVPRQALNLVMADDVTEYLSDQIRHRKYPLLGKGTVISMLDKLKDLGTLASMGAKGMPKLKRKQVDAFLRRLREEEQ